MFTEHIEIGNLIRNPFDIDTIHLDLTDTSYVILYNNNFDHFIWQCNLFKTLLVVLKLKELFGIHFFLN